MFFFLLIPYFQEEIIRGRCTIAQICDQPEKALDDYNEAQKKIDPQFVAKVHIFK